MGWLFYGRRARSLCTLTHLFHGSERLLTFAPRTQQTMKKGIHPENYRLVVFKDMSNDYMFLGKSCAATKDTVKWEDGNEYPLIKLDISHTSHPFYTGKMMLVDTAGRVDKFNKRFAKHQEKKAG
jgi:large subunit ribosomal protein L31